MISANEAREFKGRMDEYIGELKGIETEIDRLVRSAALSGYNKVEIDMSFKNEAKSLITDISKTLNDYGYTTHTTATYYGGLSLIVGW